MSQDLLDLQEKQAIDEAQRYMSLMVRGSTLFFTVALILDISAAIASHIALWQTLLWLCLTCIVVSAMMFLMHIWIGRNNL